jgi:hypothetical protein
MGGAITAVAATTMAGAIIAIGGDFHGGHTKPAGKTKRPPVKVGVGVTT